jgi:hypothetical protein
MKVKATHHEGNVDFACLFYRYSRTFSDNKLKCHVSDLIPPPLNLPQKKGTYRNSKSHILFRIKALAKL